MYMYDPKAGRPRIAAKRANLNIQLNVKARQHSYSYNPHVVIVRVYEYELITSKYPSPAFIAEAKILSAINGEQWTSQDYGVLVCKEHNVRVVLTDKTLEMKATSDDSSSCTWFSVDGDVVKKLESLIRVAHGECGVGRPKSPSPHKYVWLEGPNG